MNDLGEPQPSGERRQLRRCPVCGLLQASSEHMISCQAERIQELTQELAELRRRLSMYENSNSPPSKNSLLYREMRSKRRRSNGGGSEAPKKPGRKDGHRGVTRVFKPTESVTHTMERCPRCDSARLTVTSTEGRTVVDIPEPLPYTVREHVINVYSCPSCGAEGLVPESARTAIPSSAVVVAAPTSAEAEERTNSGNATVTLGRNALSTISMLWSVARLPLRKISYTLGSMYGLRLSPATIGHALGKVSERLRGFQERVRKTVNKSKRANFDETGMPVAGKRGWVWVAATRRFAFVVVAIARALNS